MNMVGNVRDASQCADDFVDGRVYTLAGCCSLLLNGDQDCRLILVMVHGVVVNACGVVWCCTSSLVLVPCVVVVVVLWCDV